MVRFLTKWFNWIRRQVHPVSHSIPKPEYVLKSDEPRIFVISDTHFNHRNIIRMTRRPHRTIKGMNWNIIQNWNETVRPQDSIFFLGDFAWSHIGSFISKLNGRKTFIKGNHDRRLRHTRPSKIVVYKGIKFLLIHNPRTAPRNFDGWIIHGHVHNANLKRHPFIDRVTHRVNVSVELIGYRPISLHRIVETISLMEQYGYETCSTRKQAAWLRKKAAGL